MHQILAGLFALMAVADGLLDEATEITAILPELAGAPRSPARPSGR